MNSLSIYPIESKFVGDNPENIKAVSDLIKHGDISSLLRVALDPKEWNNRRAIQELIEKRLDNLKPFFHKTLRSPDISMRQLGAYGLQNIKYASDDFSTLEEAYRNEKSPEVKSSLLITLANSGDSRAIEILISALKDSNRFIRQQAIRLLGRFTTPRVIQTLKEVLFSPDLELQNAAMDALASIGPITLPYLFQAMLNRPERNTKGLPSIVLTTIDRMGPDVIQPLINWLQSSESLFRDVASDALIQKGNQAIPAILDELDKTNKLKEIYSTKEPSEMSKASQLEFQKDSLALEKILMGIDEYWYSSVVEQTGKTTWQSAKARELIQKKLKLSDKASKISSLKAIEISQPTLAKVKKPEPFEPPRVRPSFSIKVRFPDQVKIGEEYPLKIYISAFLKPPYEGYDSSRNMEFPIEIDIHTISFRIMDGSQKRTIQVPGIEKPYLQTFTIVPKQIGKRQMQITFSYQGHFLGIISLVCDVI